MGNVLILGCLAVWLAVQMFALLTLDFMVEQKFSNSTTLFSPLVNKCVFLCLAKQTFAYGPFLEKCLIDLIEHLYLLGTRRQLGQLTNGFTENDERNNTTKHFSKHLTNINTWFMKGECFNLSIDFLINLTMPEKHCNPYTVFSVHK